MLKGGGGGRAEAKVGQTDKDLDRQGGGTDRDGGTDKEGGKTGRGDR
jgi:hypothetical protein